MIIYVFSSIQNHLLFKLMLNKFKNVERISHLTIFHHKSNLNLNYKCDNFITVDKIVIKF